MVGENIQEKQEREIALLRFRFRNRLREELSNTRKLNGNIPPAKLLVIQLKTGFPAVLSFISVLLMVPTGSRRGQRTGRGSRSRGSLRRGNYSGRSRMGGNCAHLNLPLIILGQKVHRSPSGEKFVSLQCKRSRTWDLLLNEVWTNLCWKTTQEQTTEDKIWLIIIREQG